MVVMVTRVLLYLTNRWIRPDAASATRTPTPWGPGHHPVAPARGSGNVTSSRSSTPTFRCVGEDRTVCSDLDSGMPLIEIYALKPPSHIDPSAALTAVNRAVGEALDRPSEVAWSIWHTLPAGHYAVGDS